MTKGQEIAEGSAAKEKAKAGQRAIKVRDRGRAQVVKGTVVSDKMDKTCIVTVERQRAHRLYLKNMTRTTRLFVHDEKNECKVGDVILAVHSRPLSKHKSFRLKAIVEKGSSL